MKKPRTREEAEKKISIPKHVKLLNVSVFIFTLNKLTTPFLVILHPIIAMFVKNDLEMKLRDQNSDVSFKASILEQDLCEPIVLLSVDKFKVEQLLESCSLKSTDCQTLFEWCKVAKCKQFCT